MTIYTDAEERDRRNAERLAHIREQQAEQSARCQTCPKCNGSGLIPHPWAGDPVCCDRCDGLKIVPGW